MPSSAPKQHRLKPILDEEEKYLVNRNNPAPPQWPSFRGNSQFAGTSPSGRVTVFFDPTLGRPAQQNAQDLLNDADRIARANDALFASEGGPVSVIIFALDGATDGTGGADHLGCDFITGAAIEVCASFGNSGRVSALFEAELSECSMGGNLCGVSTGEALSRWCAAEVSNNALSDFATAPLWANRGMPDFVNNTDSTDTNPISTGCGMAFLSWLRHRGFSLGQIAQGMVALGDSGTLAELYASLTGDSSSNAWPNFKAALNALPGGVGNDDPFAVSHIKQQAYPLWTVALASKALSAVLTDVASGKAAHQIVAGVRTVLAASYPPKVTNGAGTCYPGSRRLIPPEKIDATY